MQNNTLSLQGGHTHARDLKTKIMAANQIHNRSMSYNYIKCSREKYTVDLHLKIKRYTCIVSLFKKLSVI
jgi:hypothetical protein